MAKRRCIYFIDQVKFHLDEIDGLGAFVEIEVIDRGKTQSPESLKEICRYYMDLLEISPGDLIDAYYSDLIDLT